MNRAVSTNSHMKILKEGSKAPDFSAVDQHGREVRLSDFKNKKNVVLYFYPKDMTPGCTSEACDFRDHFAEFDDTEILGVSIDPEESHRKFIEELHLPFTLLSDTDKMLVEKYGVWREKTMYGKKFMGTARSTFIIDKKGVVRKIFPDVNVKGHVDEVLKVLQEL